MNFNSLRKIKILKTLKKQKSRRILLVVGVLLTLLIVSTQLLIRYNDPLVKMYEEGVEKLAKIHWAEFPSIDFDVHSFWSKWNWRSDPSPTKDLEPTQNIESVGSKGISSTPLPEASIASALMSKWSWPSFFKTPATNPYPDRKLYPIPQRITLSHIEGNNFTNCFATNFTKAQLLFAGEYVPGTFLPQIDFRGDRFDDLTYAASGGVVLRYIPKEDGPIHRIIGLNVYYDFRQGNIGYFNQIGGGIEILSERWDFRANVYVPVGGKTKLRHCVFDDFIGDFFAIKDSFESIAFSYNAEIGYLALNSEYLLLYLAGGPYYIAGRTCFDKTRGGEFRIQPQYKDYIALNAIFSYDPLFNAVYQFEFIVHLPLYRLSKPIDKKATCGLTSRQIYQPVIRYDVMPIGRCTCWMFNWDDLIGDDDDD